MPPTILMMVVAAGALLAVQAPANAAMGRALGSASAAAFFSFLIGLMVMAAIVVAGPRPNLLALREAPPFAWIGGAIGALVVLVAAYAVPRIGAAALLAALMAGQLVSAVVMDHYGLAGLTPRPLDARRLAGLALVVLGLLAVRRD